MGKRNNRSAGLRLERKIISLLAAALDLIPYNGKNAESAQIGSTRAFAQAEDARGVDVWTQDSLLDEYAFQIKERACRQNALTLDVGPLQEMSTDKTKILITNITRKSDKGRFMSKGCYVTIELEDFITILTKLK